MIGSLMFRACMRSTGFCHRPVFALSKMRGMYPTWSVPSKPCRLFSGFSQGLKRCLTQCESTCKPWVIEVDPY